MRLISNSKLGNDPKHEAAPNFKSVQGHFTTSAELRRRPPEAIFRGWPDVFRALRGADVVKRLRMDLKLGITSRFGPISDLEFEE